MIVDYADSIKWVPTRSVASEYIPVLITQQAQVSSGRQEDKLD